MNTDAPRFPYDSLVSVRPLRTKRGKRWCADPMKWRCSCGALVTASTNLKNDDMLLAEHRAPDGSECADYAHQVASERTNRIVAQALGEEFAR